MISKLENPKGLKVGMIQLNRPKVLNALNIETMNELLKALQDFDKDSETGCIIITGNEKAFAAGADINDMASASAIEMYVRDQFATLDNIRKIRAGVQAQGCKEIVSGGVFMGVARSVIF